MELDLYHDWNSPYSAKVRKFISMTNFGPHIHFIEIDEEEGATKILIDFTGKEQVPCLVINGGPMQESGNIINWPRSYLIKQKSESL